MSDDFDPKSPLFKYTRREYADTMIREGKFRIGTLHDFRRVEEYGGAIGDIYEGRAEIVEHIEYAEWPEIQKHPLAGPAISAPPDAKIPIKDTIFTHPNDSPDLYVYCMTKTPTAEGLQEFGNNACVRIDDPLEFGRILTEELTRLGLVNDGMIAPCVYGDRHRRWEDAMRLPTAFVKSAEFDYQTEVRIVWEPASPPLSGYVDILCPAAAKLLSIFEIPDAERKVSTPSRHALRFNDEELLRQTFALTYWIVGLIEELESRERMDGITSRAEHDQMSQRRRAARDELKRLLESGMRREITGLVREYANRGLRDRRIERALVGQQDLVLMTQIASCLQRLGELFEIHLARKSGRPLRLEQVSSYRFWWGPWPYFYMPRDYALHPARTRGGAEYSTSAGQ
jgi:hypothetical protein